MKRAFLSVLHEYATYCMKFSLESLIGTSLWINCHKYSLTKISCSTTRTVLYKFACILLCLGFQCKRKQFPKKFASYVQSDIGDIKNCMHLASLFAAEGEIKTDLFDPINNSYILNTA